MTRLSERGLIENLATMREGRKVMAGLHAEAVRRLGEAETQVHALGKSLGAVDATIEAWESVLNDMRREASG